MEGDPRLDAVARRVAGALQERLIAVVPLAKAVSPVGAPGTVVPVVALSTLEAVPAPLALMADTR